MDADQLRARTQEILDNEAFDIALSKLESSLVNMAVITNDDEVRRDRVMEIRFCRSFKSELLRMVRPEREPRPVA